MLERARVEDEECPEFGELLLATEGEIPAGRRDILKAHLRHCSSCRDTLARHRATTETLTRSGVRQHALASRSSSASARSFSARLAREKLIEGHETPVAPTQSRPFFGLRPRHWLPIAAAIPILVTGFIFSSQYTETLEADELLSSAVRQQQVSSASLMRRLRIRVEKAASSSSAASAHALASMSPFTRDVGPRATLPADAASISEPERELALRLTMHHFDPQDPLNPARFQAWRASLPRKHDIVEYRADHRLRALTVTTDYGDVWRGEIVIRLADAHAVRQSLMFQDGHEIVVEEVDAWVVEAPPAASAIDASRAAKATGAAAVTAPRIESRAPDAATETPVVIALGPWLARAFPDNQAGARAFGPDLLQQADRLVDSARAIQASSQTRREEQYRAFTREFDVIDGKLSLFLGTQTRDGRSWLAASNVRARTARISTDAEALRQAVRHVLAQKNVPTSEELAAGAPAPAAIVQLRTALETLWTNATSER